MEKAVIVRDYERGYAKVCNCADCSQLLLGACHEVEVEMAFKLRQSLIGLPPLVEGRIKDRPYCRRCFEARGGCSFGRKLRAAISQAVVDTVPNMN